MLDWNLALIDVASAWVVVALPGFLQARLLQRSAWLDADAQYTAGVDERATIDPTKHTSLFGTLLTPALTSLAGLPVIAWGKAWELSVRPPWRHAWRLAAAAVAGYALLMVFFALLLVPLALVYLSGAPVAARAGQLCARMVLLNLMLVPVLDSGIFWRALVLPARWQAPFPWIAGGAVLLLLTFSGALRALDRIALQAFFYTAQVLRWPFDAIL